MDRRTLDIVIKASNETKLAFEEIKVELDGINDKLGQTTRKATEAGIAMGFFAAAWALITKPQGWVQAIIFAVAALGPFIPIVLSATVVTLAFASAIAVLATTFAIGLGALGALAAGIVFLGEAGVHGADASKMMEKAHAAVIKQTKLHTQALIDLNAAQAKYNAAPTAANASALGIAHQGVAATTNQLNAALDDQAAAARGVNGPMEKLVGNFQDMVGVLELKALPITIKLLNYFADLIPVIGQAGATLMDWFNARLPSVLGLATGILNTLGSLALSVGSAIGKVIDFTIAHAPEFQAFFKSIGDVAGRAIDGLVNNLLALSGWFLQRLPAMAPIAAQIFGFLGSVIQGVGTVAGKVVDWFVQHWPEISAGAQKVAQLFRDAWNDPTVQEGIKELKGLLADVVNRLGDLKPLLPAVGLVFKGLALVIEGALGGLLVLADTLERIVAATSWLLGHNTAQSAAAPVIGGRFGGIKPNAHAAGLDYVPFDNYPALLHRGERVQTAQEASRNAGSVVVNVYGSVVTERQLALTLRDSIRRLNMAQT